MVKETLGEVPDWATEALSALTAAETYNEEEEFDMFSLDHFREAAEYRINAIQNRRYSEVSGEETNFREEPPDLVSDVTTDSLSVGSELNVFYSDIRPGTDYPEIVDEPRRHRIIRQAVEQPF